MKRHIGQGRAGSQMQSFCVLRTCHPFITSVSITNEEAHLSRVSVEVSFIGMIV